MKYFSKLFIVFVLILSIFSCTEKYEAELVGTWLLESLGDSVLAKRKTTWTFSSDGRVEMKTVDAITDRQLEFLEGDFSVDTKWVFTPMLEIKNVAEWYNGKYQVDDLKKSILVITRREIFDSTGNYITDGAFLRKEFTK
jgi:hypothetical protein